MRGTLTSATEIRRPPQFGPERFGDVGNDLEVILLVEGERQRERDLVGALEAGMGVQRVGEFVGGPYVVGGEQHAAWALRRLGPFETRRRVCAVLPNLLTRRGVGGDDDQALRHPCPLRNGMVGTERVDVLTLNRGEITRVGAVDA